MIATEAHERNTRVKPKRVIQKGKVSQCEYTQYHVIIRMTLKDLLRPYSFKIGILFVLNEIANLAGSYARFAIEEGGRTVKERRGKS